MADSSTIAAEALAGATVEARRFLARVKPRILKTETGRVVTTAEIAANLVKQADLEHAVLPGKRPTKILCEVCKTAVDLSGRPGPVPKRCAQHTYLMGACSVPGCDNRIGPHALKNTGMCRGHAIAANHPKFTSEFYRRIGRLNKGKRRRCKTCGAEGHMAKTCGRDTACNTKIARRRREEAPPRPRPRAAPKPEESPALVNRTALEQAVTPCPIRWTNVGPIPREVA